VLVLLVSSSLVHHFGLLNILWGKFAFAGFVTACGILIPKYRLWRQTTLFAAPSHYGKQEEISERTQRICRQNIPR
jgi:hypothetical protein